VTGFFGHDQFLRSRTPYEHLPTDDDESTVQMIPLTCNAEDDDDEKAV
jgi:hypothetical protein